MKKFDKKYKEKSSKIRKQTLTLEKVLYFIDDIKLKYENKEKANKFQLETLGNESYSTQLDSPKENNLIFNKINLINNNDNDKKNNIYLMNNNNKDLSIINETLNDNSKITKSKELNYLINQIEIKENSFGTNNMNNLCNKNEQFDNILNDTNNDKQMQLNNHIRVTFSNNNMENIINKNDNYINDKNKNGKNSKEKNIEKNYYNSNKANIKDLNNNNDIFAKKKYKVYLSGLKKKMEKCKEIN